MHLYKNNYIDLYQSVTPLLRNKPQLFQLLWAESSIHHKKQNHSPNEYKSKPEYNIS